MCFFLIHPDLFTLVVCIKTMLMLAIWLARRSDGSFVRLQENPVRCCLREITAGRGTGRAFQAAFPSSDASRDPSKNDTSSRRRARDKDRNKDKDWDRNGDRRREDRPAAPAEATPRPAEPEAPPASRPGRDRNGDRRPDAANSAKERRKKDRRRVRDDLDEYAPPGLGPPVTDAGESLKPSVLTPDLADDLAERTARRKRRGAPGDGESATSDNGGLTPDPGPSDDSEAYERGDYEYDSDNAPRGGDPGASFFERFKRFDRSNGGSDGPRRREPSSPPDLYTTRQGGRVAAPGVTQQQYGHTVGRGGYKGIYLDESISDFQCPIEVTDKRDPSKTRPATRAEKRADSLTAPWERALEHDSIDLLQFYLFAEGVHDHVRGWIIMDLLEERDEVAARGLAMGWKEVYQLPLTSTTRKTKIRKLLEPYRHFEHRQDVWRPAVGDWWSRARFGAHGAKVNVEYGLDDLLWSMRASGVSPAARHAMVRDLLSQPNEDAYLDRKKRLLEAVEMKDRWDDPVKYKAVKDELVYHYQKKDKFGGRDVISQKRLAELAEEMQAAKVPRATIGKILREIRWNLPKGGWRGVLKRIQDAGDL